MRVLVFAGKYQFGHLYYDQKIIKALSEIVELVVMCPIGWEYERLEGVLYVECAVEEKKTRFPHISLMHTTIKNYILAKKKAAQYKVDCILALEYELLSIWFLVLTCNIKLFLIHHYNVDQLAQKSIYKFLFTIIKNRVRHIVVEPYIGTYLIEEENVPSTYVYCWPNPVDHIQDNNTTTYNYEKIYDCVGISNSNDDSTIHAIIDHEKTTGNIKKSGLKVILRSNSETYDNGGLKVITGRLDLETYEMYIRGAKTIYLCYPNSFVYRASGLITDAIRNSTPILSNYIELIKYYSLKYPNIFMITDQRTLVDDIYMILNRPINLLESEFMQFRKEHGDQAIQLAIKDALTKEFPNQNLNLKKRT